MNHIVGATAAFRDSIEGTLEEHHITLDEFTQELEAIFMGIANNLEKASGYEKREEIVDKVLEDTTLELTKHVVRLGIEEEVVTTYLLALKPHVHKLIVAVGDINEQHPQLFPILAFCIDILLIPELWILRSFLSMFGFGPEGPVKGSPATCLQSRFWGAAVEHGSWFALLQAAGIGVVPEWVGFVAKVPLLIGLLAKLLPSNCE